MAETKSIYVFSSVYLTGSSSFPLVTPFAAVFEIFKPPGVFAPKSVFFRLTYYPYLYLVYFFDLFCQLVKVPRLSRFTPRDTFHSLQQIEDQVFDGLCRQGTFVLGVIDTIPLDAKLEVVVQDF